MLRFDKEKMIDAGTLYRTLGVRKQTVLAKIRDGTIRGFKFGFSEQIFILKEDIARLTPCEEEANETTAD